MTFDFSTDVPAFDRSYEKLDDDLCRVRVGDIEATLQHDRFWEKKRVEVTLAKRQGMKFRMLLGRTAIADDYLVDAKSCYLRPLGKGTSD